MLHPTQLPRALPGPLPRRRRQRLRPRDAHSRGEEKAQMRFGLTPKSAFPPVPSAAARSLGSAAHDLHWGTLWFTEGGAYLAPKAVYTRNYWAPKRPARLPVRSGGVGRRLGVGPGARSDNQVKLLRSATPRCFRIAGAVPSSGAHPKETASPGQPAPLPRALSGGSRKRLTSPTALLAGPTAHHTSCRGVSRPAAFPSGALCLPPTPCPALCHPLQRSPCRLSLSRTKGRG